MRREAPPRHWQGEEMSDFLQVTVDKFTFRVAQGRLYSAEGVWVLPEQSHGVPRVLIGLTDFLQQHNGDVAFANVKAPGSAVKTGDEFAELETMKVNVGLPSPVSGIIVEVNKALELTPENINQDPYDKGWLVRIEVTCWEADRATLLEPLAYLSVMQSQAEQEVKS
jgi:glycine cleavage system H protein